MAIFNSYVWHHQVGFFASQVVDPWYQKMVSHASWRKRSRPLRAKISAWRSRTASFDFASATKMWSNECPIYVNNVTCWACWACWACWVPCSNIKNIRRSFEDSQSWPWLFHIVPPSGIWCPRQRIPRRVPRCKWNKHLFKQWRYRQDRIPDCNNQLDAPVPSPLSFHTISWYIWRFFDILYHMYMATVQTKCFKNQSSGETDSAGLRRDRSPEALESRLKPRQLPLQLSPVNFVNWADLVWYLYTININKPCGIENSPKQTQLLTNWQCSSSSYSSEAS